MRLVYDIECNGLDPDTIWVLVAYNIDTEMMYCFSDHDNLHGSIKDGLNLLSNACLLYTSPSPRDRQKSRMPSSA